ncbi:MAG: EAL domain-containing protein, partial [Pseudomonadota bacterium]
MAIIVFTHLGIQYAMRILLVQHAHATGMDWAHHIEVRAPTLSTLVNSDPESDVRQAPSAVEFTEMVSGMLSVGNIYQVDVINAECYCDISLGTYAAKVSDRQNTMASVHTHGEGKANSALSNHANHVHAPKNVLPQSSIDHVFSAESSHQASEENENRYAIDRQFVQEIAATERHDIILHSSDLPNQPGKFAEVYHPVTENGEVAYILRLMVDLDRQYSNYNTTLYAGATIIILLVAGAFCYPAAKYLKTSRKQKAADKQAHFLANHDIMTNANNRNSFQNIAPKVLDSCARRGQDAAIFLFDVDNFKEVNDYHSHEAGDLVICALADILKQAAPDGAHVARLGGDEFAIIVGGIDPGKFELEQILDISTVLRVPIDDGRLFVKKTISGGVSIYPRDGSNLEELMRCADLALYTAKSADGGDIVEYNPNMSVEFYERLDLRDEFINALENSEIVPYYQPLVNMHTGAVVGFEALARWDHPQRGILAPAEFQEMLADHELSALVGAMMLRQVVQDMKRWKSNAVPFESIGINVCEGDLLRPGFALNVISELKQNGLRPKNLAIEITESCMFGSNKEAFIGQLENLRMAGCRIALDDFGTGYS